MEFLSSLFTLIGLFACIAVPVYGAFYALCYLSRKQVPGLVEDED